MFSTTFLLVIYPPKIFMPVLCGSRGESVLHPPLYKHTIQQKNRLALFNHFCIPLKKFGLFENGRYSVFHEKLEFTDFCRNNA